MAYRVAQWGTGLVGAAAARRVIATPDLELVACFAHGTAKIGRDAGEIVGVSPIGVTATGDVEAIIAARPDCVLYMPLQWSVDHMARLLEAGINVISTANFITGRSYGGEAMRRLEASAQTGGVSLFGTGFNPGLANVIGLAASACSAGIERLSVLESVDATAYASAETWHSLGYGGPADAPGLAKKVRERTLVFIDTVEMMAEALDVTLDDIAFQLDTGLADKDLALGYMDIAKGTVCGTRMTYSGMKGGRSVIELSQMWRLGGAMTPDWKPEGYVVELTGQPNVRCTFKSEGDPTGGGMVTAMNAVNAIPQVCAARPGIVRVWELPVVRARHAVTTPGLA